MIAIEVIYVAWQIFLMSAALAAGIMTGELLRGLIK
jgi:hypothetical protein